MKRLFKSTDRRPSPICHNGSVSGSVSGSVRIGQIGQADNFEFKCRYLGLPEVRPLLRAVHNEQRQGPGPSRPAPDTPLPASSKLKRQQPSTVVRALSAWLPFEQRRFMQAIR